jgi:hypothetical protein
MGSLENSAGSPLIMVMTEALEISAQPPALPECVGDDSGIQP